MNFLAHFHLAWPDGGLVAGALEGDYYKGPIREDLPLELAKGVRLHRAIDAYTDAHPRLQAMRGELPEGLRRYAGILIDLSFDHFLSRHWARFSDIPQNAFNHSVHHNLLNWEAQLSDGSRLMLARLIEHNILQRYGDWKTVAATAEHIGQRFRRGNPFTDVDRSLAPLKAQLETAFLEFYPDLMAFSAGRRDRLNLT